MHYFTPRIQIFQDMGYGTVLKQLFDAATTQQISGHDLKRALKILMEAAKEFFISENDNYDINKLKLAFISLSSTLQAAEISGLEKIEIRSVQASTLQLTRSQAGKETKIDQPNAGITPTDAQTQPRKLSRKPSLYEPHVLAKVKARGRKLFAIKEI